MPRRCCIPECNSNYDSALKRGESAVSTFSFPREETLRDKWIEAIPRANWRPTKGSFVCSKHFSPEEYIYTHILHRPDGSVQEVPLPRARLAPGAVPHVFCNLPKYLSDEYSETSHARYPPLEPALSHTAESSCPSPEDCCEEMTSHSDKKKLAFKHSAIQCNECGLDVVGYRYKCVQCADCDLCAACEALGAHPEHYMLRIPRPLQLAEVQAVVELVRGCFEAQGLVEHREVIQSGFKTEEEEIDTIKTELIEEADEAESCGDPLGDLQPKPPSLQPGPPVLQPKAPSLQPGPPVQQQTANTPLTPAPYTVHRRRKFWKPDAKIILTKLLKPCSPTATSQAPSITLISRDIDHT